MSSRIKKSFFFQNKEACLFYYCDLPLGYRIIKNSSSPQQLGQLVCILAQTGQVFSGKLASNPHLNLCQEWNQSKFKKLFDGMQNFTFEQAQDNQEDDIQLENVSHQGQKKFLSSKTLLVRDPTYPQQEIYLLRCNLKQIQFHKGRIGIHRLWQQFQKYHKFMRRQEAAHERQILQLDQRKQQKFKQINLLITQEQHKKNQLRQKLTMIWREKTKKVSELSVGKEHLLEEILNPHNGDDEESSMVVSDISHSDVVNSQEDRPLTGSLFEPSQSYFCREESKIVEERNK